MSRAGRSRRRWLLLLLLLSIPYVADGRRAARPAAPGAVISGLALAEEAPSYGPLASDSLFSEPWSGPATADIAPSRAKPPAVPTNNPRLPITTAARQPVQTRTRPAAPESRVTPPPTDSGSVHPAAAASGLVGGVRRLLRSIREGVERLAAAAAPASVTLPAHHGTVVDSAAPFRAQRFAGPKGKLVSAEPVLTELQLGRIAMRTVEAYRAGDDALIPLGAFFELAEIRASRLPDGTLEAMVQPGNVRLVIDPARRTLRIGKQKLALTDDEIVATDDEIYLATKVMAKVFSLEWDVSWPDLQVTVIEPASLPVARRIRREALLEAQLRHSAAAEYTGLRLGLERSRLNGLVLDYSVLTPTNGLDAGAYATTFGLDLFGGSLALGLQSQNGTGKGPRTEASWTGIWRDNPWLSQVQLGDGISTGPRVRTVRGFALSNSPYVRPSVLGNIPFSGQLGGGWTVEAYRGGRLIGFDSVNPLGQYSFDVPIEYGENPVDFIAYGPFGEVREFNQTYRLRNEGLAAGRLEYGVSAGECRTTRCRASGNVDLRYGLSTRWTARAGVDQFWRGAQSDLSHPYVGLLGTLTNSIAVEGEAVGNAVLRGAVRFEPSVDLQLQAEAHRFAQGVQDPILTPDGRLNQLTLSALFRPISRLGSTYLEAGLDRVHAATGDITSSRVGASLQVANVRLLPSVRFEHQTTIGGPAFDQTFFSLNSFVLAHPELGPFLGAMTARTSLDIARGTGPISASVFVSRPITRGLRAETGATWYKGGRGTNFSLLVAAELPSVRSYTTVTAGGGTPAMGTQYVTGSAIYNPASSSVDFSGSPSLARGGVTGRVFLDANGNGKFDRDEQPLPGVRVVVGPTFAFSDSSGDYHVWDVLPYEPTAVTVDSATLASPLWAPAFAAIMVEPSPNRYRRLDIPVLPGGVIEGQVVWPTRGRGTGGVSLVLSHKKSGERRIVTTFGDGSFYAIGVRPGEWELVVDPKVLELLQVTATPLKFTIAPSADGTTVEGLKVELR